MRLRPRRERPIRLKRFRQVERTFMLFIIVDEQVEH